MNELKQSIGTVTSNAGSYNVEGDSLVFMRDVALWPNAMADRKRLSIPMPIKISKDTLYWEVNGYKNTWVRRK